jgi:hypothetical protein
MTCRKFMGDIKTGVAIRSRDGSGGCLLIGQAVSGIKVARAWSGHWCGTWEPVVLITDSRSLGLGQPAGCREGKRQGAETLRRGVPMRGTGTDCPVVVVMPGNAGGAKGTADPGFLGGQPPFGGMSS